MISEVSPADEGFTLYNNGAATVDLKGYVVTDGEGSLTFTSSRKLPPGTSVTVSKVTGTDWFNSRAGVLTFTSSCITRSGSFTLANSGDDVKLTHNGSVVDSVCYGNSAGVEGWLGDPARISSGHYLLRISLIDTDTKSDWVSTKAGWTNLDYSEYSGFDAIVYPFSFPDDCGRPVLSKLSEARHSIDISIYLLSSPEVVSLLCQMENDGVEVRVLAEGSPLGVDISTELSLLKSLSDSGGEVRIINYSGSEGGRYSYVHNKYAVIDGCSVILTSENWTKGNIGEHGNRGWGVVIDSEPYASYMARIFENDYSTEWGDVKDLTELYPRCKGYGELPYADTGYAFGEGFRAKVCPAVSPDNSFRALENFISSGMKRVYVEQMDLGSNMAGVTGGTPVAWLSDSASRGVDVKFILDSSQSNGSAHESYVNLIINASSVKAVAVNGRDAFTLIHNKGVIVDDRVWIGSVNWTETSFSRNRESAVIIDSAAVADYFASLFLDDFGRNEFTVEEEGLNLEVSVVNTPGGTMVLLSVDGPSGTDYVWERGDGVTREGNGNRMLFPAPSEGSYVASVQMKGSDIGCECAYEVFNYSASEGLSVQDYALILAGVVLVLGIIVSFLRRSGNKVTVPRTERGTGGHYR